MINLSIIYDIEIEGEIIPVRFNADCYITNDGIGRYEFWGCTEYDYGLDYVECEDIKWEEHLFNLSENAIIKKATKSSKFKDMFERAYYNYIDNLDIL